MKTLGKLKLNQIGKGELEKREMRQLVGGECCGCGCNGPSSTDDNFLANWNSHYSQSYGGAKKCAEWYGTWQSNC
jgi:natural product precursor